MAILEDVLEGNIVVAAAVGATALILPKVLPDLPPRLRSLVKSGVSLFLEAESEAEGGIINRLADTALKNVLHSLSGPGSTEDRESRARAAVEDFKRTADERARRYGRDESDRAARYTRHIEALRDALGRERSRHKGAGASMLDHLLGGSDAG
jgi:hypothetical protein